MEKHSAQEQSTEASNGVYRSGTAVCYYDNKCADIDDDSYRLREKIKPQHDYGTLFLQDLSHAAAATVAASKEFEQESKKYQYQRKDYYRRIGNNSLLFNKEPLNAFGNMSFNCGKDEKIQ